jgi:hypothetical protein
MEIIGVMPDGLFYLMCRAQPAEFLGAVVPRSEDRSDAFNLLRPAMRPRTVNPAAFLVSP